ncbi:formyltransferase family protein [Chitinophaga horti]|uniref:Formyltransferase family protein n=1 Tax=Chitinophaga horti TaxID=2920382 RepID=A0ABY6J292_9BACT|nr:formyltransferase family protein [Chitinophaga horti]UYQ92429.1 formyltransferase family protein [Chitinophaga horti]
MKYVFDKDDIDQGDVCFLLSCRRIISQGYLDRNSHNIVIHASDLPRGKGFSPLQWQVFAGMNEIPLTLFEAVEGLDAGPYYMKDMLVLEGTELYDEMRRKLGNKIIEMSLSYIENFDPQDTGTAQSGEETVFPRRRKADDMLDIDKSIREQFNHLRIADNEQHPLWFTYQGKEYIVKIFPGTNNS